MEPRDYVIAIRSMGFTQAQIAEKTGIPQPTISKVEQGRVSDVMSRSYRALQAAYAELIANPSQHPTTAQETNHA